jgi:zinc transport system substrate-binding protein
MNNIFRSVAIIFYIVPVFLSSFYGVALASEKLNVYVVNYPLQYFAERIAGEHATVIFPAPDEVDPAYWMPDKKIIEAYQQADLILLNGAHYAKWVAKVTLPRSKMVDTSRKFKDRYITNKEITTHSHGAAGEHGHEDAAFTLWLDFDLAVKQAKAIEKTMSRKRPELSSIFQKNYEALAEDLMDLDKTLASIIAKDPNQPLVVSHPVYDYLARRYGLNIKSVQWEPDEIPSFSQWQELHVMLVDHSAKWMIWEGEPLEATVLKLEEMGIRSLVFEPCSNVPEQGDFLSVMQRNTKNLGMAFH